MSRYRRSLTGGASFFFTVNTYQRRTILTHPEVRAVLRDAIERVRESMPFTIDAWVLLPDHLHAIWTLPENDAHYGKRWGVIKARVSGCCEHLVAGATARSASRIKRRETDFW
jgi:putative transposase